MPCKYAFWSECREKIKRHCFITSLSGYVYTGSSDKQIRSGSSVAGTVSWQKGPELESQLWALICLKMENAQLIKWQLTLYKVHLIGSEMYIDNGFCLIIRCTHYKRTCLALNQPTSLVSPQFCTLYTLQTHHTRFVLNRICLIGK